VPVRRVIFSTSVVCLFLACTSTYQVKFRGESDEWPAVRPEIEHCLSSLGFRNISSEDFYADYLVDHPDIVAVWESTAEGSFLDVPPFAVAWVLNSDPGVHVHFQPSNSQGPDAKFFADTFTKCIQFHQPSRELEITSSRIVLDLR